MGATAEHMDDDDNNDVGECVSKKTIFKVFVFTPFIRPAYRAARFHLLSSACRQSPLLNVDQSSPYFTVTGENGDSGPFLPLFTATR
ncbi:hypothetical protein GQ457_09G010610 [Hibiscus cannabinus]